MCPCCDGEVWSRAFDRVELDFDGEGENTVHYDTCIFCGYTKKTPTPKGLDDYYSASWQSPPRSHKDEALWLAETLRGHGKSSLDSAFDAGARTKELLDDLSEHMTLGVQEVLDPNTGGGFLGTDEFKATDEYELVCATHVLEHVTSIPDFMRDLKKLSRDFIFIEVPSPELESWHQTNDDIARTHLHHFTLTSLIALANKHELSVLRADCAPGDRLMNNRILLRTGFSDWVETIRLVNHNLNSAYIRAVGRFASMDPEKVGLYGRSDAHHKFTLADERVKAFRVFDLYRGPIEGIEEMEMVVLMPRQPQVRQEIKAYLDRAHIKWMDPWESTPA